MNEYLLDSDVFMQAKNTYYSFDFCPAFWEWLDTKNNVRSIDEILKEIKKGDDDLTQWAKARKDFFENTKTPTVFNELTKISTWVDSEYEGAHARTFLDCADCWLIAHAKADSRIVVTQETYAPNSKRVKIPNVCEQFNIKCVNTFEMLRTEKAKFVCQLF